MMNILQEALHLVAGIVLVAYLVLFTLLVSGVIA